MLKTKIKKPYICGATDNNEIIELPEELRTMRCQFTNDSIGGGCERCRNKAQYVIELVWEEDDFTEENQHLGACFAYVCKEHAGDMRGMHITGVGEL